MKYFLLFYLTFSVSFSVAQTLSGTYITTAAGYKQQFTFKQDSVRFLIVLNAGIVTEFKGTGAYMIRNNKNLLITTAVNPKGKFSVMPIQATSSDTLIVTVNPDKPVIGASVMVRHTEKTSSGSATNLYGQARLSRSNLTDGDSVTVSYIGYQTAHFRYNHALNYTVKMSEGINDEQDAKFISNKGKGFDIRIRDNSILVKIPQEHSYKIADEWVEFFKQP